MVRTPLSPPYVLISGLGPVTALGFGVEEMAEGIQRAAVTQGLPSDEPSAGPASRSIPPFELGDFLDTPRLYEDLASRSALASGCMALDSAGVLYDEVDTRRFGLAVASAVPRTVKQPTVARPAGAGSDRRDPPSTARAAGRALGQTLATELFLHGWRWNGSEDPLCGARALEAACTALREHRADLMLAGGVDAPEPARMDLEAANGTGVAPAQGGALMVLETQDSLERREGYAFCEVGAVACERPRDGSAAALADALRAAVAEAIESGGLWEGDIGAVFLCSGAGFHPPAGEAEAAVLERFSRVPQVTAKDYVGETFAAAFPIECTLAAHVLLTGELPPRPARVRESGGVELWVRGREPGLMGWGALVVGCTAEDTCAAVLRML